LDSKWTWSFLFAKKVELSNSKVGPLLTRLLNAFWGAPKHDNNTEKWRLVHSLFLWPLECRSEGVHKVPLLPKPRAKNPGTNCFGQTNPWSNIHNNRVLNSR
jgi:hypothetical protein